MSASFVNEHLIRPYNAVMNMIGINGATVFVSDGKIVIKVDENAGG